MDTITAHFRSDGKAYDDKGRHIGPGDWLTVIHTVNRLAKADGFDAPFGTPDSTGKWWAGGYVEEYGHARVLHREDETVSVISKSDRGADLIRRAAAEHGWHA